MHRVIREDDRCYVVAGADGKEMTIAKAALSPAVRARVLAFSAGGAVPALSGATPESESAEKLRLWREALAPHPNLVDPDSDPATFTPILGAATDPMVGRVHATPPGTFEKPIAGPNVINVNGSDGSGPGAGPIAPETVAGAIGAAGDFAASAGRTALRMFAPPVGALVDGALAIREHNLANKDDAVGEAPMKGPSEMAPRLATVLEAPSRPPEEPAAPRAPGLPALPKTDTSAIDASLAQQERGLKQQADAAQGLAQAQGDSAAAKAADLARFDAETKRQLGDIQGRADAVRSSVVKGEVDPNHLWNNLTSGQQVGAAISLFLGGFGASLARGPNYALQVFDKAIDNDIATQEKALAAKRQDRENLLASYVQQGHDLVSARRLARADYMDIVAAQLEGTAAKYSGLANAGRAEEAAGKLKLQAFDERQKAVAQSVENQFKRSQMGLMASQAAENYAQAGAAGAKMKGDAQTGAAVDALAVGARLDPRVKARLPAEVQARIVDLPDGKSALAKSPKAAETAQGVITSATEMRGIIREMAALRSAFGSETANRAAVARGEALQARMTTAISKLEQLGALDDGVERITGKLSRNPTDWQTDASFNGKLVELNNYVNSKVTAHLGSALLNAASGNLSPDRRAGE